MTIIHELTCRHAGHGGSTRVVVGSGTRHDYPVGEAVEVPFGSLPSRRQKGLDAALGRLGGPRPLARRLYAPALDAVERDFTGPVFVHNNPAPLPLFARRRPQARPCLYVHNVLFRTYGRREARRVIAAADRVICVSNFIADDLAGRLGRVPDNVRVVHNGADIERFRPREGQAPEGDPLVLFLSRVVPDKGAHLLVRAAARLLDGAGARSRRFRVRIVGSSGFSATDPLTPYEQDLRRLAEPLGDAVEFRPFVDREEVLRQYHEASIFCVPSDWDDPCPLTVAEGLACGLPMVVSRRGGIPEVAGEAALYFRPPDTDGLAEALAHLIDDEGARSDWGRRARQRAESFSWEHQYVALRDALEDRRTS